MLAVVVMLILVGLAAMGYKHFHQSKGGKRSDDAVEYMRRQPAGPLQTVARRLNRVAPPAFADASVIEPARARTIRTPTPPSSQGSPRARSVGTPPSLSSDGPTRGGAIRTLAPPSSAEPAHDPCVELTKAAGQPIGINLQAGRSLSPLGDFPVRCIAGVGVLPVPLPLPFPFFPLSFPLPSPLRGLRPRVGLEGGRCGFPLCC